MSQINLWFRLNVDWHESDWLAELPWEVRAVWPVLLGHVKQNGRCGICRQPITARFCAQYDIPVTAYNALCNAAIADGALRVTDGNWEISHWAEYQQEDPTNAERQRRYRKKKRAGKSKIEPEQPQLDPSESESNALRNTGNVTRYDVTPTIQYSTRQKNIVGGNTVVGRSARDQSPEPGPDQAAQPAEIQPPPSLPDGESRKSPDDLRVRAKPIADGRSDLEDPAQQKRISEQIAMLRGRK